MRHDETSHDHSDHHAMMAADFRRRLWISLVLTVPVFALAPMIQELLGLRDMLRFTGDSVLQLALATVILLHGGRPFLAGLFDELRRRSPGMMTLVGLAIVTAYGYSALVVLGLDGRVFFWELATLIDVMLLGHWIEMRSVMSASGALEALVKLMPDDAHRLGESGAVEGVTSVDQLTLRAIFSRPPRSTTATP